MEWERRADSKVPRPVTRTHKMFGAHPEVVNDESGPPESKGPRYFAKHGPVGANPHKTKKDGGGRANWWAFFAPFAPTSNDEKSTSL